MKRQRLDQAADPGLMSIGKPCLPGQEKQKAFFAYLEKRPGCTIKDLEAVGIGRGSAIAMIGYYSGIRLKVDRKTSPVTLYPL